MKSNLTMQSSSYKYLINGLKAGAVYVVCLYFISNLLNLLLA